MRMNRKNVLMMLGILITVGGAVLGSGAFTSVEADRQAEFTVTGDNNAYLQLNGTSNYVDDDTSEGNNEIAFSFESLNDNSTTTVDRAFEVSHNSEDSGTKYVYIDNSSWGAVDGVIDFENSSDDASIVGEGNAIAVDSGETVNIDIEINTSAGDPDVDTITIIAQDTDPSN